MNNRPGDGEVGFGGGAWVRRRREPGGPSRSVALDVTRAIVIVGVVFNHAVYGLIGSGAVASTSTIAELNHALYVVRMPALAVMVGLLTPHSVVKRGSPDYVRERSLTMLYLYVLWFFIQGMVELWTSGVKNEPRDPWTLVTIWAPIAHLWFLPFLVLAAVAMAYARPWESKWRAGIMFVSLGLLGLSTWGWDGGVAGLQGLGLLVFVGLGATLQASRVTRWLRQRIVLWFLAGALATTTFLLLVPLGLVPATRNEDAAHVSAFVSIVAAAVGTVAIFAVGSVAARVPRLAEVAAAIGRATLPIYLAHVIVVAGGRVILSGVGVNSAWALLLIVPAGVLVPYFFYLAVRSRPRLSWLFSPPPKVLEIGARRRGFVDSRTKSVAGGLRET